MILVFKVAGNLTKGWRLGRFAAPATAGAGVGAAASHQERALAPAQAPTSPANAIMASDRVRSTVASIEAMSVASRLPAPAMARLALPPAPVPALPGPSDARGHMRYLHHRVAGATNFVSREIFK
jgi:hypothetical protein